MVLALTAIGGSDRLDTREDGRGPSIPNYGRGHFVRPTVLEGLPIESEVATTEIFGPVLSVVRSPDFEEAVRLVNEHEYGNGTAIFTQSGGRHARKPKPYDE